MSSSVLSEFFAREGFPAPGGRNRQAEVAQLEQRYGVTLPDDFRDYLLNLCPLDDEWDDNNGIWWGIGSIKSLFEDRPDTLNVAEIEAKAGQYLLFIDQCLWCWAWAIACTDDENRGKVALICGEPDRFVAPSFTAFAEAYVKDWSSVNPG